MLERFKPLPHQVVRVSADSLYDSVEGVFLHMGTTKEDAAEGANTLTMTDLRGVETHGVSNMLRNYVESYTSGHLNPRPDFKVVRDKPSMATVDADQGLAVILGPKMMRMAIEKAKVTGVGVVTLYNSGHSGGIGHHAMLAAEQDMVGMVLTSGGKSVLPTFGAETRLGTNPIALAAPARNEPPFLFDAATSAVAGNKTGLARRVGTTMLPGWLANLDGSPMDEPSLMMEQGSYHLLPLGSTREQGSHKGYGLGMIVEIMATLLSGVAPSMLDSKPYSKHHFAAYDISAFCEVDQFKDNMDQTLKMLRETPTAPGHDRVLYPGLSEHEEEIERRKNGVPLHTEVVEWFEGMSAEVESIPPLVRV